jgi:Flp pilus assembly protein TadG
MVSILVFPSPDFHGAMRQLNRRLRGLCSETDGSIAVATALLLPILVGFIALGLDTANWYSNHRQIELIVETAAMAAAPYLSSDTTAQIAAIAENVAALNGLSTSGGDTIAVTVASNPATLTVTGTRKLNRLFSAPFLPTNPVTTVSAMAGTSGGTSVCILVLDRSSSQTLLVNSGVTVNASSCEIDVASSSSSAAMFNSRLPSVAKVCVAGSSTVNGGSTINNLTNNCTTASDPYAGNIATPTVGSCTVNGSNYSGTTNLSPGTYCGSFNFNGTGTLNLAAGLYIFNGTNWNINSGWTINGTGVTFYFATSGSYIQFNSNVTANLSAPTSGTYANILMFEPAGLSTSSFTIDGTSSGHLLQGVIHLPSRNITFNSASNVTSDALTLVVNQLILDSVSWSISPDASTIAGNGSGTHAVLLN